MAKKKKLFKTLFISQRMDYHLILDTHITDSENGNFCFWGITYNFHKLSSLYTKLEKVDPGVKTKYVQLKSLFLFTASLGQVNIWRLVNFPGPLRCLQTDSRNPNHTLNNIFICCFPFESNCWKEKILKKPTQGIYKNECPFNILGLHLNNCIIGYLFLYPSFT